MPEARVEKLIRKLFPFSFEVDRQLRISVTGPSLQILLGCADDDAALLEQVLSIEHPHLAKIDFEQLKAHCDEVCVIRLLASGLRMRGQLIAEPDGSGLLFIGSPWFSSSAQIAAHGLKVSDFAPHDPALEHVILLQSQKQQFADLQRLNDKLQLSLDKQQLLTAAEESLLYDLDIAADLHLRIGGHVMHSLRLSNGSLQQLIEATPDETPLAELPPCLRDWVVPIAAEAPIEGITRTTVPLRIGGKERILDVRCARAVSEATGADEPHEVIIIARDVTAEKQEYEMLHQTLERATDAVVTVAEDSTVTFFNHAAEQLWGFRRSDVIGAPVARLCAEQTSDAHSPVGNNWIANVGELDAQRGEVVMRRAAGQVMLCSVSVSSAQLASSTIRTAFVRDITEQREIEQRFEHQARFDPLTALPNREYFRETLEQHMALAADGKARMALLLIDIDDFKQINDLMGHQAGDQFLRTVAERIQHSLRDGDLPCRLGGDEFAIMLFDPAGAMDEVSIAERVLKVIRKPMRLGQVMWNPSASIGIANLEPGQKASELLRQADLAMYEGKYGGKGTVTAFNPRMKAEALEKIQIQENLSYAIDNGEIYPVFQPIIDLRSGLPLAIEALARWEDSEGKQFMPGRFIPLAEGSDLIVNLGESILRQSMRHLVALIEECPALAGMRLNVNISPRHFIHPKLVSWLDALLSDFGLPASSLVLELTEHVLISEPQRIRNVFSQLHELGVRLSLDDFGTGYSSLSYLNRYEFDQLKIDRSFVLELDSGPRSAQLAHMIIKLAEVLDLEVIAEGIETPEQERTVLELGGRLGQGFLYYRPQRIEALTPLITACLDNTVQLRKTDSS